MCFLDTIRCSDLAALKLTAHFLAIGLDVLSQCLAVIWSNMSWTGSATIRMGIVSSADKYMSEVILVTMSWTYTRNNKGPNMDPSGSWKVHVCEMDLSHNCYQHGGKSEVWERYDIVFTCTPTLNQVWSGSIFYWCCRVWLLPSLGYVVHLYTCSSTLGLHPTSGHQQQQQQAVPCPHTLLQKNMIF